MLSIKKFDNFLCLVLIVALAQSIPATDPSLNDYDVDQSYEQDFSLNDILDNEQQDRIKEVEDSGSINQRIQEDMAPIYTVSNNMLTLKIICGAIWIVILIAILCYKLCAKKPSIPVIHGESILVFVESNQKEEDQESTPIPNTTRPPSYYEHAVVVPSVPTGEVFLTKKRNDRP